MAPEVKGTRMSNLLLDPQTKGGLMFTLRHEVLRAMKDYLGNNGRNDITVAIGKSIVARMGIDNNISSGDLIPVVNLWGLYFW